MSDARAHWAAEAWVLGLLAALYHSLSCTVSLEWVDEGHLIYQSWQVAHGAVPYRDFQHVYAPGVFLVNGLLLHLFGDDLLAVRFSLVVVKAVTAVLVYLVARQVAAARFALIAYLSVVIVSGGPWWVFNTPYATHYAVPLCLLGALAYLHIGGVRGGALAGFAFGVAAIFKQTTGVFAMAVLVVLLCWEASAPAARPSPSASRAAQLLRFGALLAAAALLLVYLAPRNTLWNGLMLGAPLGLAISVVMSRELRGGAGVGSRQVAVIIAAGLATVAPLAIVGFVFAALGAFDHLIANTVSGLPQVIRWFTPVPSPDARFAAVAGVALAVLALARRTALPIGSVFAVLGLGGLGVVLATRDPGTYLSGGKWIVDVYYLVCAIPFVVTWGALLTALRIPLTGAVDRARVLVALIAAAGFLALYPAADFWHVVMAWPMFAPALAWQLERACRPRQGGVLPALAATIVLLICAVPFVQAVVVARLQRPDDIDPFARATRIADGSPKSGAAAALVRSLDGEPPDRRILAVGEGAMLQFLAGRRSALEREEFALYLVATGFIDPDAARALVNEQQAIARIAAAQPIVVVADQAPSAARFRSVFRELAAYIDAHYRTVATFGPYRVMTWSAA